MNIKHLTHNDQAAIRRLVENFLDGDTTPSQEAAIYSYYASHRSLPPDLEQYRAMFGWYSAIKPRQRRLNRRWIGFAASVALIFGVGLTLSYRAAAAKEQLYASYSGSYIIRDGIRIDDIPLIINNLTLAEQMADSITEVAQREARNFEQLDF